MPAKVFPAAGLAIALVACGGDASPTAPASTLTSPVPPRLTGVVQDDHGAPVAGATVTAAVGTSAETDALGQFHVTTSAPEGAYFGLQVYKSGYEHRATYVRGPTAVITLHGPTRVQAGELLRVTVGPGEAVGPAGEIEYLYRTVRIFSPTPTVVEIRVVADDGGAVDWQLSGGPCCPPPASIVASIEDTGAELGVTLRVPFWPQASRTFTVITRKF